MSEAKVSSTFGNILHATNLPDRNASKSCICIARCLAVENVLMALQESLPIAALLEQLDSHRGNCVAASNTK